jgi:hypothetical protein
MAAIMQPAAAAYDRLRALRLADRLEQCDIEIIALESRLHHARQQEPAPPELQLLEEAARLAACVDTKLLLPWRVFCFAMMPISLSHTHSTTAAFSTPSATLQALPPRRRRCCITSVNPF